MRSTVLFLATLFLLSSATIVRGQSGWLALQPNVVQLQGKLLKVMKYGPPGYGESPDSDAHYEIPILLLSQPIRVEGDPLSAVNREDLLNVSFVQLIFHGTAAPEYWRYANRNVIVSGSLFRAQTAHHYTPLVMDVKKITGAGNVAK